MTYKTEAVKLPLWREFRSKKMDRIGAKPVFRRGKSFFTKGTNVDNVCPSMTAGLDYIRNPRLFRGMAFTIEERQGLGNFFRVFFYIYYLADKVVPTYFK